VSLPQDDDSRDRPTAGPVGAGDPPPPPVAKASSGEVPPTPPPAGGSSDRDTQGSGASSAGEGASETAGGSRQDSADPAEAEARDLDRVEHDLDDLLSQRDEYLDLAKRTKADFENYRKRMGADVLAATGRGKAEVLRDVLPVLDDLERAIQAAGLDPEGDSPDGLAHGVLLVFRSLREALVRNGIESVDPQGERFDPHLHEALSTVPADSAESGTVVEVMQKGYRLGEQLIRPARVVVAE
jgi:molecular chaperone GrpE